MIKYLIFIVFILLLNCNNTIQINDQARFSNLSFNLIKDNSDDINLLILKNINEKEKSQNLILYESNNQLSIDKGCYNIYFYNLSKKDQDSYKITQYYYINKELISNYNNIGQIKFIDFNPDYEIEIDRIKNKIVIIINMYDSFNIFKISSMSVKQGKDKYRRALFEPVESENKYKSTIEITDIGEIYLNINYSLKNSINSDFLKENKLSLSTTNFQDIYLGTLKNYYTE